MNPRASFVLCSITLVLLAAPPSFAQNDDADKKTIKKILAEIELVPSLYAKGETLLTSKTAPKFSSVKLVSYPIGKINTPEKEREKWEKDKESYARENPLRAAVLEAAFETANLRDLKIFTSISTTQVTPKEKAKLLLGQASLGMSIFKLEQVLAHMREAAQMREKEKSARWKVDFDFAMTRVEGNLIYLYEYNFNLGSIRADNLPELSPEHDGWKIAFRPKATVTEPKAKSYVKDRAKRLEQIQKDHPGTPWAYFAERDSKRDLGMAWVAKKK